MRHVSVVCRYTTNEHSGIRGSPYVVCNASHKSLLHNTGQRSQFGDQEWLRGVKAQHDRIHHHSAVAAVAPVPGSRNGVVGVRVKHNGHHHIHACC
jgi:hypothetical protein